MFALDASYSRVGSLTGPLLGALLIPLGFSTVSFAGAAIFAGIFVMHALLWRRWNKNPIPHGESAPLGMVAVWASVITNKKFVVFAILYSTYLLAYNQQYLSLPVELRRAAGSDSSLGWFFTGAAIFVIALQTSVTRWAEKQPTKVVLGGGFGLMAASFAVVGAASGIDIHGWAAYLPAVIMMVLLHTGIMIAVPIARDLVGDLASNENLGSYYGFLNGFGGLAVLLGSVAVGATLDKAEITQPAGRNPVADYDCAACRLGGGACQT